MISSNTAQDDKHGEKVSVAAGKGSLFSLMPVVCRCWEDWSCVGPPGSP